MLRRRWLGKISPLLFICVLALGAGALAAELEPVRSVDALASQAADERALIARKIDLTGVQLWQRGALAGQRAPKLLQLLRARSQVRFLVIHLWATWCPECKTEFKSLLEAFPASARGELEFIPICTSGVSEEMEKFFANALGGAPRGDQYLSDGSPELFRSLGLEGERLPLTLLVERRERDLVVRQAFIGSIEKRRNALLDSIDQLLVPQELSTNIMPQCSNPPCIGIDSFLHKQLDLGEAQEWNHEGRKWQKTAGPALQPGSTPWLLYLCNTTERYHRDCAEDWFRLRQMLRSWLKVRGGVPARFSLVILDQKAQHAAEVLGRYAEEGFLPSGRVLLTTRSELLAQWRRIQQPVALLLDQHLQVRLAYAGPFRQQLRIFDEAIDRLHALR